MYGIFWVVSSSLVNEDELNVLGRLMAGLVKLHPDINYFNALPVKMFEYMV